MGNSKTIVISLGGSIISPEVGKINVNFLKNFRRLILKFLKKRFKFIIIVGGGRTCRLYQLAASKIVNLPNEDRDWLGIHATRLNAHLLRTIFRRVAYPVILDDPKKPLENDWKLLVAAGWRPGWSTDYIAVLLARRFKIKEIINAGDVSFVYDKDPDIYKNAEAFRKITWREYRKLVSLRWSPGLSTPFDPIAAKEAQKLKIRAIVIRGTDIKNFERLLSDKNFRGTMIEP